MRARSTGGTIGTVGVVTLVLAALLGSAYALGRSMLPDHSRPPTGTSAQVNGVHYADQPADPVAPPADPDGAGPDPDVPQQAGGGDGPFGSHASTGSGEVALTFDDGPDPTYTPQVLDALREYGVKATFCVVGENAQDHPDLVRAIVADGHTLCNHSWHHDVLLGKRSPALIRADLIRTNEAIHAAVPDARISYFRQPGGAWTYPVVSVAEGLGMTPLHWTVDPNDWQLPGAAKITATVTGETGPGAIVLMHDAGGDRQGTVDALRRILPDLTSRFRLAALPVNGAG
ncbi:polysaccharide deacetylase family protein [Micromonospora sp. WMMD714]|uniref:polysaccharide deacetylase family protein n=1 Tax=Micromonospora sp. WMMD714 TaxID=3016097 RepID=UPI00249B2AEC|nr:polysaccharide deacetylase family protein [Micromonospora sp. WMMD714]WFE67372.1 polysaccharide deacetylase family protein [Micromonospora sp. WMMD714]